MTFLKMMIMERKCILYCFKLRRLTLGIGNFMSSHSHSAGHVPLGLGRDNNHKIKLILELKVIIQESNKLENKQVNNTSLKIKKLSQF